MDADVVGGKKFANSKTIADPNGFLQQTLTTSSIGQTFNTRLTKMKALSEFGSALHDNFLNKCRDQEVYPTRESDKAYEARLKACYNTDVLNKQNMGVDSLLRKAGVTLKASKQWMYFNRLNIVNPIFQMGRTRWERLLAPLQQWFEQGAQISDEELRERFGMVYKVAPNGANWELDLQKVNVTMKTGQIDADIFNAVMQELVADWASVKPSYMQWLNQTSLTDIEGKYTTVEMKKMYNLVDPNNHPRAVQPMKANGKGEVPRPGCMSDVDFKYMMENEPEFAKLFAHENNFAEGSAHYYLHGTGANRWDVRPGFYADSVLAAGGVVASGHSAGTAYMLFGHSLLGYSSAKDIYSIGLYATAWMGFGGYHSALEAFPIVQALAEGEKFAQQYGPVYKGTAFYGYNAMKIQVKNLMSSSAASRVSALLGAYKNAVGSDTLKEQLVANQTVIAQTKDEAKKKSDQKMEVKWSISEMDADKIKKIIVTPTIA